MQFLFESRPKIPLIPNPHPAELVARALPANMGEQGFYTAYRASVCGQISRFWSSPHD